jgi:phenylpropionate dioxygenase-like ring-hydroxylating dioxygenase large terminal subunit
MSMLMDERALAERVLEHIANGTTDLGTEVWREPVANYRSEARLAAERRLMRGVPTAFCPSAALAATGAYVAREAAGTPLLVVRGEDGEVRAFRNACRHRGMLLAAGAGCSRAFVCTYHGWTYGLDGRLRHVAHEHGFPGLDKEAHGLVPVAAEERLGLVFVTQEQPALEDPSLRELPPLLRPGQTLFETAEREIEANWKIVLEGFLEGYHIRTTHRETFFPYGFDNINVVEKFGGNSRIVFPFRRAAKQAAVPPAERRLDGGMACVHHLFPNVLVIGFSRHTWVIVLEPVSVERTRMLTWKVTNPGLEGDEALQEARRDAEFVETLGIAEDRAVVCAIQRALASGANEAFTFGLFESAIVHFHKTLAAALGPAPSRA